MFKTNLEKWSKDMHCVVQFLKKIPQEDDEKKRAQVCIDILFQPKKTSTMDHLYVVNTARK